MYQSFFRTLVSVFFALALLTPTLASDEMHAHPIELGDLTISNPWTRAMPPTAVAGGGFVTITNKSTQDDRLVSAQSNVAGAVELHEMSVIDDVMRMQSLPDGLLVPAGETIELKPGGLHIMFIGVETPFVQGEMIAVTLTFETAGSIQVMLPVAQVGSSTPPMDHAHH